MNVELLKSVDTPEWDEYVQRHPAGTAYHLSGWRTVIASVFGRESFYLVARDGGAIRGLLPLIRLKSLLFGDFLVSMPYLNYGGVLSDTAAASEAIVSRCREIAASLGVRHVELRHTENTLELPVRTDKVCMHLALPEDSDLLLKGLGSKLRAQIKRPVREGAKSSIGGLGYLDEFYAIFSRKYRDLGVPVYPKRWFRALLEEFPDMARIHLVTMDETPVAASIVIRYRESSEVVWAASVREADRLGANMFLYWSMLKSAIEDGSRVFDFGRTSPGSGTYRFKKQWGTTEVPLYWHYLLGSATEIPQLNLDNPKYHAAAGIWRRLPVWATNRIGPHLVKNLP